MEQVSSDSDEPKVTHKRAPNPPGALFVEPAVPAQDHGDGDASSAEAQPTADASRPSGGTPAEDTAAKRAPKGRAKPVPATFEAAPSPKADAQSPKLTAQPRSKPTSEGLAIDMPTFSAPEAPQTPRRLAPKPTPPEPSSVGPTPSTPEPAGRAPVAPAQLDGTPVASAPIAPTQRRKAPGTQTGPGQRTPATKRAATPVEQALPTEGTPKTDAPLAAESSITAELPTAADAPAKNAAEKAAKAPVKKAPAKNAVKKAAPRKVAKKAAAKAIDRPDATEMPPAQPTVETIASIEPPTPPAEIGASTHSPVPPAPPTLRTEPALSVQPPQPVEPTKATEAAEPIVRVAAETERAVTRTRELTSANLWIAVKAEPRRAPAAVALAIVERYASDAQEQADWLAKTYPAVAPALLARVAQRNAARRTRVATMASAPFAGLGGLPLLALAQARLVLEVAAIFGRDPRDPQRAAEVLVLLGVYPDAERAAAAADSVANELREVPRLPLRPRLVGLRLARGVAGRFWPGAGLLISGLAAINSTDDLGTRVIRFYECGNVG